jgi:ribosomal protein S12 methylthiotransferase
VDSEVMLGVLARAGHEVVLDPDRADVLVVNTCAFVGPAKEESIDAILEAARVKAAREGRRLVVTGCLAQRYADELVRALPEVDAFVGTGALTRIAEAVNSPGGEVRLGSPAVPRVYRGAQHELPPHGVSPRVRTGAWWTAYLKVSDGCDHRCSFCIIPAIRGRHESRPLPDLLAEAESLASDGAIELNLIAQDLTAYGRDLGDGTTLARLLRALAVRVPQVRWLRLLYAYPSSVTDELLDVIATEPAVCKYLDIPLQHVADDVLRAMRRERSGAAIRRLLRRIRAAVPGIALRSAFIVGFPGETDAHVDELCGFLEEVELDRVGVFRYSDEEGTHAAGLPGQVPEAVKRRRWERVMATQAGVAARRARRQLGRVIEVLVEGEGPLVGRSSDQAPEIDGLVRLRGAATPGGLVLARITGAGIYDLDGEVVGPVTVDTVAPRL